MQALTFKNCTNLTLSNLKLLNAQQMHVNFQDCKNVEASKLLVVAPDKSPNTDGIHVTRTSNINIMESEIRTGKEFYQQSKLTHLVLIQFDYIWLQYFLNNNEMFGLGDDCVSIVNGSRNVQVKNIVCGPGHGIRYVLHL